MHSCSGAVVGIDFTGSNILNVAIQFIERKPALFYPRFLQAFCYGDTKTGTTDCSVIYPVHKPGACAIAGCLKESDRNPAGNAE